MKYKILKGTPLFDKFMELKAKMSHCHDEANKLVESLGHKVFYESYGVIRGGVSGIVIPSGKPEGWALAFKEKGWLAYMPKKNKANKELWDRIKALPVVTDNDLNSLLNYDPSSSYRDHQISYHPGFCVREEYVLVDVSSRATSYVPVDGMMEITVSEFNKLSEVGGIK